MNSCQNSITFTGKLRLVTKITKQNNTPAREQRGAAYTIAVTHVCYWEKIHLLTYFLATVSQCRICVFLNRFL